MSTTQGASYSEQLLEAARRNNIDLLNNIVTGLNNDPTKIAHLLNESKDAFGNTALHLCAKHGSWDVLDKLLDQEGDIEVDPQNITDGDTPLHCAVRLAQDEPEEGTFIAKNLIAVGADPRIRNKQNQKPVDLIHGNSLTALVDTLQGAELAVATGAHGVAADDDEDGEIVEEDDD
ncbi:hypothetical protein TBLA_0I03490 [Henningerozyma blattae CBS 6284]|uniref:Uncharacterized protein n=1 Tax=Henningerozyma blattae (strain ATCC 34711 / CBS 6284 / DSM 70876 / NBRC 10599 / NRRL Y-10934 / UCD 77-7) TaxID=1071380 RepID=I2H9F0_HENB6|nr:hypothetical protein TBLA_0I03490 [Tetrapisispora blattae CBS 6284]CCH63002.1 hypothetical protein TBLA_0I03490 [Tetrapisispora blattae CBS 6284]